MRNMIELKLGNTANEDTWAAIENARNTTPCDRYVLISRCVAIGKVSDQTGPTRVKKFAPSRLKISDLPRDRTGPTRVKKLVPSRPRENKLFWPQESLCACFKRTREGCSCVLNKEPSHKAGTMFWPMSTHGAAEVCLSQCPRVHFEAFCLPGAFPNVSESMTSQNIPLEPPKASQTQPQPSPVFWNEGFASRIPLSGIWCSRDICAWKVASMPWTNNLLRRVLALFYLNWISYTTMGSVAIVTHEKHEQHNG